MLGAIQAGQLVALATTGPQRVASLPTVPTMAESGFPGFDMRLWVGVFERAGVPPERNSVIERAIARAMESQDMQVALRRQGITPLPMSRSEFNAFVAGEVERWREMGPTLKR